MLYVVTSHLMQAQQCLICRGGEGWGLTPHWLLVKDNPLTGDSPNSPRKGQKSKFVTESVPTPLGTFGALILTPLAFDPRCFFDKSKNGAQYKLSCLTDNSCKMIVGSTD